MIRLRNVTVARGAIPILTDLSVDIEPGRIWWVVGPNGAGKSTLLRVLAELDPPRAGTVSVLPAGARVLYFASAVTLPPTSTVADWERLIRRLARDRDRSGRMGRGGRTAIWPEVPGRRRVGRLSTGERKRLLLDALLRQPGAMVLDEPFEHLSPEAKKELQRLLEARALEHVVVVATNQGVYRADYGGLRLGGGTAALLDPRAAEPPADGPEASALLVAEAEPGSAPGGEP